MTEEEKKPGTVHFATATFAGRGGLSVNLDTVTAVSTSANTTFDTLVHQFAKRIKAATVEAPLEEEDEDVVGDVSRLFVDEDKT